MIVPPMVSPEWLARSRSDPALGFGVVRWARLQNRLNPVDENDVRIPAGGTPGWVVGDIRVGYRLDPHLVFGMVFENVSNEAYRYHGSSVNGPGRGLIVELQGAF